MPETIQVPTNEATAKLAHRADAERRRRTRAAEDIYEQLGDHLVLAEHPIIWSTHPVPYCGGACPGGETWPCLPVRLAFAGTVA